ncbi:unnamed protein product [Cuscuta europaea]|uniref:Transposase MuDR plant domain-containing protein n=1 Tax=Cuscuta europaea TaxID=41803 RepID=A0A9P1EF43_CUSEU|nr:unnamed protein product [Cuscuta europaea]
MVIEEEGRYVHNGASFVNGQGSDDDADDNINGDDMTESDEDDGDTVMATAPSSHFTRIYDLPEGFTDVWMSRAGMKRFTPEGEFEVRQQFDNKEQVINMVSLYPIKRNQFYLVLKSDKHKWVAECKRKKERDCPWRIRATKNKGNIDNFTIVRYPGPHSATCVGNTDSTDHVAMTSDFIAKDVIDILRTDPSLKVHTVIEMLKEKYGYTVSYKRAWMGKQKAIAEIFGWEKSYSELPHFMTALQHSNPGTVVHWYPPPITPTGYMQFQRVFWAFKPSIHGFKHCRPVLTIDGTH